MPGSVAARSMAWHRRMGGSAGPLSASGEASNGEPVQVEMYINGSWVDITAYVMVRDNSGNISITRGRRDEGTSADAATMQLLLDNRDGRFSPRNPSGAYYGLIGRNTPIRVSVPNGMGGKGYRFWGEVTSWPVGWDTTGTDVYVELEASGLIRRLSQAPPSAKSVIYSAVINPDLTGLRAYWPCEDSDDATRIESALVNGSAMTFFGVAPDLAASTLFGASDPLPVFTSAAMRGGVATYTDPTATQVRFLLYIPPEGANDLSVVVRVTQLENISVADVRYFELFYNSQDGAFAGVATPGALSLESKAGDGSTIGSVLHHTVDVRGKLLRVSIELEESGANVVQTIRTLELLSGIQTSASQTTAGEQLTRVTTVTPCVSPFSAVSPDTAVGLPGGVIGHITVQDTLTSMTDLGISVSPVGEVAGRRVQRLCVNEGIAFESIGDLDDSVAMGGQSRLNMLELAREAELADGGVLYETLAVLGMGYRTRSALINQDPQLTLNYAGFNLSEIPKPVEDDRFIQNKVTVTVAGVSQTYELAEGTLSTQLPPVGVGVYGEDVTLNLEDAGEALSQAAWRVHLGTVDEPRYPQIAVNLAHSSFTDNPALKLAVLGLRPGDRIVVQNLPSWLPPGDIDQIILGFEETISRFEHRLSFVCAPARPYQVGVLGDSEARMDTDGTEVLTAVSSSDTALSVTPSNSIFSRWTTDSADMPFDIRVGGEVMRVTSATGYVEDTFTRVTADGWGTADSGQSWTNINAADSDFSTSGTEGRHSVGSLNSSRISAMGSVSVADLDFQVDMATSVTAAGGPQYAHIVGRYISANNTYAARLRFNTDQSIDLTLQKRVGGTQSDIETVNISGTHVAGTFFTVRFQIVGTTLRAKAWETGAVEPDWLLVATDGSLSNAGAVGTRSILDSANSNPLPVTFSYDNFQVINPQTFTVTRSVNGVSRAQVAGEDVRLADPTIISL